MIYGIPFNTSVELSSALQRNSVPFIPPFASENEISHIYRGSAAGMVPVAGQYIDDGRRGAHGEAAYHIYLRESQPGRGG